MNNESIEVYEARKQDRFTLARKLAESELCPKQFRGKPADIMIVMRQAETLGCDPQSALANMFVVHGTAGYSSKFLIALANRHGVFDGPIRYKTEGRGKDAVVTAWAKLKDGTVVEGISVDWNMAKASGWTKNPKYNEMPELMYRYRSAAFLIRTTCPETAMGMLSLEEIEDMHYADAREVRPEPSTIARLEAAMNKDKKPEVKPDMDEAEVAEPEAPDVAIMRGEDPEGDGYEGAPWERDELFDTKAKAEDPA